MNSLGAILAQISVSLHKTHTIHIVLSHTTERLNPVHAGSVGVVLPLISTVQRNPIFARLAVPMSESGVFYFHTER